jgi:uracil-DNA glycosylase family 4
MSREEKLKKLAKKITSCKKCPLYKTATQAVPGAGDPETEVMFIGEAPGYWEDQKGIPFCGAAGRLLDKNLKNIDLKREEVFIGNILKHRPPENRDPLPQEVKACQFWLDEQIKIINPKVIVLLGRFSMAKFIPNSMISKIHGLARWVDWQGKRILVMPMYHPAAALRNGKIALELEKDFSKLKKVLNTLNNQSNKLKSKLKGLVNESEEGKDNKNEQLSVF